MQKVFEHCYDLDKRCYDVYGLTEDILMENAARGMAEYIKKHFKEGASVLIVAGGSNNGADGIVLARQLHGLYDVRLFVNFGVHSDMAKIQLKRAQKSGVKVVTKMSEADIVVDALFGTGLNRTLDDVFVECIQKMNAFNGFKIACDIPTGISKKGNLLPIAFKADVTITMGAYKEALYLDDSKDYVGNVVRVNLGIEPLSYETQSQTFVLEKNDLTLPSRSSKNSHKGTFGHASLFCGEKEGAGIIAGMACTRFGAGLTTLVVHENITPPPYLMHATVVPENTTALAIGMGLGAHFESEFLEKHVLDTHLPIVLDADAFGSPELLSVLEQKDREVVVTPHPKEFVKMWEIVTKETLNVEQVQANRFEMIRMFNAKYPHVTILLKGSNMLIMQEEQLYINPHGTAKLSKGGSGDVLSGLIVSLLAQGYTGIEAAIQASLAFVMAAENYKSSSYTMLATDIIEEVSKLETN